MSKMEFQRLLGLLNSTNDIDLQVKLFTTISAHLMSNNSTYEVIINCDAVYYKIQAVLSSGVQMNVVIALNFLSALLSVDDVTSCQALSGVARAQCRTCGCLAVMNDMFINRMMFHETWNALCRCLALACTECELNQSYCSYLIPVCVQKCSGTNMDVVCLVLFSLLLNHKGNIEMFLKSNGMSLFTREFIHNDKCLLLLTAVVRTDEGLSMIRQTKVTEDLRDFLQLYGPRSEIGQKALIILNHVNLSNKGFDNHFSQNTKIQTQVQKNNVNDMKIDDDDELDDTKTLLQNIMKEVYAYKLNEKGMDKSDKFMRQVKSRKVNDNDKIPSIKLTMSRFRSDLRRKPNPEIPTPFSHNLNVSNRNYDLSRLRQNFRKYIRNNSNGGKNNHDPNTFGKGFRKNITRNVTQNYNNINVAKETTTSNNVSRNMYSSKSNIGGNNNQLNTPRKHFGIMSIAKYTSKCTIDMFNNTDKQTLNNVQRDTTATFNKPSKDNMQAIDLQQSFRPIFSSTLKSEENEASKHKTFQSTMFSFYATNKLHATQHGRVNKSKTKYVPKDKDIKNKSLSSRFFGAINDSCTTIVKSVANIFTRRNTKNIRDDSLQSSLEEDKQSCSYSFLKYMQQRDAMMKDRCETNESKDISMFSKATQLCETCDNTAALKKKLEDNEHLKQTIKKLKLGINLYGCDFKKISRTMWPQDYYMKPLALYNLYRKLIAK